jgi:hypothetical protein
MGAAPPPQPYSDGCTLRKSAPFRTGANLEPLCDPLQATIRFFRILLPAFATVSFAGHLPSFDTLKQARNRAYHVPNLADKAVFCLACPVSICLSPGSALMTYFPYDGNIQLLTFWSERIGSFRSLHMTRVLRQFN